ncbi:Bax inhibitor-1/YccA family protein [Candidatus Peregrinibacteria bacterium]|nr:Bax inhibitor-1/YccA family protein [Candidatus Peregrinibacteria bacterium]
MYEQNHHNMEQAYVKVGIEPTFFGKVMSFFALALFTSALGTYLTATYLLQYFIQTPMLMWVLFIAELAIIWTSQKWSKISPLNKILFAGFAFLSGATAAPLIGILAATQEGVLILTKALLATGLTFTATAIFGWTTSRDLSRMGGFLTMGLIGMIVMGLLSFIFPWSNTAELVFSGFGVLLFSGFTAYHFNMLKHYPRDMYIEAALGLYLSFFNLFMSILHLILASRD